MTDTLIAAVEKNSRDEVRVSLGEFKGYQLCQLRVWFTPSGGGEKRPGKDGFAVQVDKLPALIDCPDEGARRRA